MKKNTVTLLAAFCGAVVIGAMLSLFSVYETDQALLIRLGKITTDKQGKAANMYGPGLHCKLPIIDQVLQFDMRLNTLGIKKSRITTLEKKDVLVDYFVQWRIQDLELYYNRTDGGNRVKAELLLEKKAISSLISEFGRLTIKEVVSGERVELMERIRKVTDMSAQNMGITVLDVRIKRIDLPEEVSESVYHRMRAERQRKANSFRASGEKAAILIRAEADKRARVMLAEASRESKRICGEGDAQAVAIYAAAYNQSPDFYEFYRSMQAYKKTFQTTNNIFILKPEGDFFKYFGRKNL